MPQFRYQAKPSPSQIVEGTIEAESKRSAIEEIGRSGSYVLSVEEVLADEPVRTQRPAAAWFVRVSLKESTQFARQLADLLESGLPIVRSLDILQAQTRHPRFKLVIGKIREACVGGVSLSAAVAQYPDTFPHLFEVLIRAGETGGSLDVMLRRLAVFHEKQLEIRDRVRSAVAYPVLMAVVGTLTVAVLLVFVVPRMSGLFEDMGQSLPLPTQLLLWASGLCTRYYPLLIGSIGAAVWASWRFYNTDRGRFFLDTVKLRLPVVGGLDQKVEVGRFSQTLYTLLESGVSILEALKTASETVSSMPIRRDLQACYTAVKEGARLSAGLSSSRTVPASVIQMIEVGEESGKLERTLQKIAENYEREVDQAVKLFLSLLEPALILVLGLVVGFMVIAILLPIFEISLSAR